ncbi:hypothetical protein LX36DRAFT_246695 [Colletotrichum falcatum]|nr:hypothetical protein LX36DRAFT_246695 [Colletotrichum falcatum]
MAPSAHRGRKGARLETEQARYVSERACGPRVLTVHRRCRRPSSLRTLRDHGVVGWSMTTAVAPRDEQQSATPIERVRIQVLRVGQHRRRARREQRHLPTLPDSVKGSKRTETQVNTVYLDTIQTGKTDHCQVA